MSNARQQAPDEPSSDGTILGVDVLEENLLGIDIRSTGAIVRARHRGSDADANMGGDWYDAVDLSGGRVAVSVGDVVGHGLEATRAAIRLRGALGLAALDTGGPTEALAALDRYADTVRGAEGTTVAFAIVDPARAVVTYASAGHPPPLLVSPSGEASYLEQGRSWPLGVDLARRRARDGETSFPPGSLLVLFTDGLIERREESLTVGLDRLASVVADKWDLPLRRLKEEVFSRLLDEGAGDDVALVVVRGAGASPKLLCDAFPARRNQQGAARRRLREWLESIGVSNDDRDAILLAVGEAVSNAIDHGSDGDRTQIVTAEFAHRGSELVAAIGDRGHWQPSIETLLTGRGRGHILMEALANDIDIDADQKGTVVTLQFALQPAQLA